MTSRIFFTLGSVNNEIALAAIDQMILNPKSVEFLPLILDRLQ